MSRGMCRFLPPRAAPVAAVLGLAVLMSAGDASASHWSRRGSIRHSEPFRSDIVIRDSDALQLQREAIAAQEEAQRAQGRKIRRDEIEAQTLKGQQEYLESQAAERAASWAARRAPRGFYYRIPGSSTAVLPKGYVDMKFENRDYYRFNGVFFRRGPEGYIVVTAPAGALVGELPEGSMAVWHGEERFHYYFGTFYREEEGGGFRIVVPGEGTVVPYIPDGYATTTDGGSPVYRFGDISYRPYYREGILVYAVTGS